MGKRQEQLWAGEETSQGQWCCRNMRLGNATGVSDAFYGFVLAHSLPRPFPSYFQGQPQDCSTTMWQKHVPGVLTTLIAPSLTQLLPLLQFSAAGQGAWDISLSGAFSLHVHLSQGCLDFWAFPSAVSPYHIISVYQYHQVNMSFLKGLRGLLFPIMAHTL